MFQRIIKELKNQRKNKIKNNYVFFICGLLLVLCIPTISCQVKERSSKDYYIEETEELDDISTYVESVDFEKLEPMLPSETELKEDLGLEDALWISLVDCTKYRRMPRGYVDDFNLRKFLAIEYIFVSRVNGNINVDWNSECKTVRDYLVRRIFKITG